VKKKKMMMMRMMILVKVFSAVTAICFFCSPWLLHQRVVFYCAMIICVYDIHAIVDVDVVAFVVWILLSATKTTVTSTAL
jgi:hypothetical protein